MATRIETLLENEDVKTFLEDNTEIIQEAEMAISDFSKILKAFVLKHPKEFVSENLEETYKNIRVFTGIATAQYITEITNIHGSDILSENEAKKIIEENETTEKLSDYI